MEEASKEAQARPVARTILANDEAIVNQVGWDALGTSASEKALA